jgi:putative inorganic carbon (hco3(-)) transporter
MADLIYRLNDRLRTDQWLYGLLALLTAVGGGWLIGQFGMIGGLGAIALPVVLLLLLGILLEPRFGLLLFLNLSFAVSFARFIPGDNPVGTSLDGLLVLTLVSTFLNGKRMDWTRLRHPIFYGLTVWLLYTILEQFNPEVPNPTAWFYKIRSISLNWFILGIIMLVAPISRADIRLFLRCWLGWSVFGAFWAYKQQYIGLADAENAWLAAGAAKTHMLWGQLRCFSFYSDASQFGAEMAGVTLICVVQVFEAPRWQTRLAYFVVALIVFWAYALSGTRSALFVLITGYGAYLVIRRDWRLMLRGAMVAAPIMFILVFTHIGDNVYQIYRMRTALKPTQDASFMVRLENQAKLKDYMKNLPFGAGLGTSGGMGARFSPNHGAAQIPPDSWYVELWIETGVVGLSIYLLMLLVFIGYGVLCVWQVRDDSLRLLLTIFIAEFIGICVMNYSNAILGQFPTSTLLAITSVLFTTPGRWDTPANLPAPEPAPGVVAFT